MAQSGQKPDGLLCSLALSLTVSSRLSKPSLMSRPELERSQYCNKVLAVPESCAKRTGVSQDPSVVVLLMPLNQMHFPCLQPPLEDQGAGAAGPHLPLGYLTMVGRGELQFRFERHCNAGQYRLSSLCSSGPKEKVGSVDTLKVVTKSAIVAGRSRAHRHFVAPDRTSSSFGEPPPELLVRYRARHEALATIHRLWMQGGLVDTGLLRDVWTCAWHRAGGTAGPASGDIDWLRAYAADNPLLGVESGREIIAVEQTYQAVYGGHVWQARPDVVVGLADDTLAALELTSARHPLRDGATLRTMAAIDQYVLGGPQIPALLRGRPCLILVCSLRTFVETDVTLSDDAVAQELGSLSQWIDGLVEASPTTSITEYRFPASILHRSCRQAEAAHADGSVTVERNIATRDAAQKG